MGGINGVPMIGWLQGQLADRWQQASRCGLLLVCGGVGYEVQMPRRQWDRLGEAGSALSLHIHQVIREDAWTLYGFASRAERDLFRELVAVSGVGPQMALGLLGQLSCEELVRAIVQADLRLLTQAPGVGKRTAERLAVELRTRLQERYGSGGAPEDLADLSLTASETTQPLADAVRDEVNLTLTALGYEALEINRALRAVAALQSSAIETADDWLRECLRWLSRSQAA
jgi:Holliday junction DNA helicase RuvA